LYLNTNNYRILEERIIGQEVILKLLEIKGTQKLLNSLTHNNSSKYFNNVQ